MERHSGESETKEVGDRSRWCERIRWVMRAGDTDARWADEKNVSEAGR